MLPIVSLELARLDGKTVLVTGATSGMGLEVSVALARIGARVVLVGRNAKKTEDAAADVKKRGGSEAIETLLGDFASQASVRQLAADYRARHGRLDVLLNNAGAAYAKRTLTADGVEATFAVNHLGAFLLTNLLLDLLEKSAPARIVNVASVEHYDATMDFNDLGFERGYSVVKAYRRSKLANVLFTRALAKKLEAKRVTVNAVHPGAVATSIWSGAPGWMKPLVAIAKRFMLSPAQGAERIAYLAASPAVEAKTGLYFEKNRSKTPSWLAQDDAVAAQLWSESVRLVKLYEGTVTAP